MGKCVGHRALEQPLHRRMDRLVRCQRVIEGTQGSEEPHLLLGPRERVRVVPALMALGDAECPVEQVAHVGQDFDWLAASGAGEGGKVVRSAGEGSRGAVATVARVWRRSSRFWSMMERL